MKAKSNVLTSDTATRAAERLLERKRMGLESAIEALETVGYAVTVDADGRYRVSIPLANTPQKESSPAPVVQGGFLAGYPDLLTPTHVAEISGMSVQHIRTLCREGGLPAVQVGGAAGTSPRSISSR